MTLLPSSPIVVVLTVRRASLMSKMLKWSLLTLSPSLKFRDRVLLCPFRTYRLIVRHVVSLVPVARLVLSIAPKVSPLLRSCRLPLLLRLFRLFRKKSPMKDNEKNGTRLGRKANRDSSLSVVDQQK